MSTDQDHLPILLPDLGTADEPIRVGLWLVDQEDPVEEGEQLLEVVLRGITFTIASPCSGRLVQIERSPDTPVQCGDVLGWIAPAS